MPCGTFLLTPLTPLLLPASCCPPPPCCLLSPLVQVFQINPLKAWSAIAITLSSVAASLYLISVSPWYLLPFAWFIAGTAFTGVSVRVDKQSVCVCVLGCRVSQGWLCLGNSLSVLGLKGQ